MLLFFSFIILDKMETILRELLKSHFENIKSIENVSLHSLIYYSVLMIL